MRVYASRKSLRQCPERRVSGTFLFLFIAKLFDFISIRRTCLTVGKHHVFYPINILIGNVHIRMIFSELLIYTNRFAFVIFNLDKMLKIRLPLLILWQTCAILTLSRRELYNSQIIFIIRFDHNQRTLFIRLPSLFVQIFILRSKCASLWNFAT